MLILRFFLGNLYRKLCSIRKFRTLSSFIISQSEHHRNITVNPCTEKKTQDSSNVKLTAIKVLISGFVCAFQHLNWFLIWCIHLVWLIMKTVHRKTKKMTEFDTKYDAKHVRIFSCHPLTPFLNTTIFTMLTAQYSLSVSSI